MNKCWFCLVIALLPWSHIAAQTSSQPQDTAQTKHIIVPLTARNDGPVSGDPGKPGAPFVFRIWNPENYIVPPHWHPEDEHVVVVKGTWYVGMGDRFDRDALRELNVGDYALMPKRMRHFGWSKTETIIQVHGIGPFRIIPADIEEHLSGWRNTPQNGMVRYPQAVSFFKFKITDRVKSKRGEGMIVGGMHSEMGPITQYFVQMETREVFCESEKDLTIVPQERLAGPLNGKWEVRAQGAPWCEDCDLYFQQTKSGLTGVYSLSWFGVAFKSSTFRDNGLEIRLETLIGNFSLSGRYSEGILSGDWSTDSGLSGKWKAKKVLEPSSH